jgi:dihydroorotase-like cyclic amidohydrolase
MIVDLAQTFTIDKAALFTQARLCDYLYDGMTFQGKVLRTILAGKTIFNGGEVVGKAGWGQFVRPQKTTKDVMR